MSGVQFPKGALITLHIRKILHIRNKQMRTLFTRDLRLSLDSASLIQIEAGETLTMAYTFAMVTPSQRDELIFLGWRVKADIDYSSPLDNLESVIIDLPDYPLFLVKR